MSVSKLTCLRSCIVNLPAIYLRLQNTTSITSFSRVFEIKTNSLQSITRTLTNYAIKRVLPQNFYLTACNFPSQRYMYVLRRSIFKGHMVQTRLFNTHKFADTPEIENIRNVAIVAHVDHGKTTLVDSLLKYNGCDVTNVCFLDQGELEKEKGITILAKTTRIHYKSHILNIVDTPGHADFGGEVERVLSMVDGIILVVDITNGPKPQTRFVLSKSLIDPHLVPIVVINKVDRIHGRTESDIKNEVFELFVGLDANDNQLEYPTLYGSAKQGWFVKEWDELLEKKNHLKGVTALLDTIINHVPSPKEKLNRLRIKGELLPDSSDINTETMTTQLIIDRITTDFSMLTSLIDYSTHLGYTVTGQVYSGVATKDALVYYRSAATQPIRTRIKDIFVTHGITKIPISKAIAGDIVTLQLQGTPGVYDTVSASSTFPLLPFRPIDPPVISVNISPNTSPLQGQDSKKNSLYDIKCRLQKEATVNVGITVSVNQEDDGVIIKGRGDLQLGIILETMRREGFEFEVTPPHILLQYDNQGKPLEPWDRLTLLIPSNLGSELMTVMSNRQADYISSNVMGEFTEYTYDCATRQFLGMGLWIHEKSRGTGSIVTESLGYKQYTGSVNSERSNLVIATCPGNVVTFELLRFQNECAFFVIPDDRVYEGMIIGQTSKSTDLMCNITKPRKLVIVRTAHKEKTDALKPNIKISVEFCLNYIQGDEIVEITPKRIAMRKKILCNHTRTKHEQKLKKQFG